jgi:hypothetical protein
MDLVKEIFIIKCNMNKEYISRVWDDTQKRMIEQKEAIATDLESVDGDKLLIKGLGIERVKYFLYPVLRDNLGNIADKKIEIFDRQKTPALIETMYNQVEDFANVARELINLNPLVRFKHKTGEMPEQK